MLEITRTVWLERFNMSNRIAIGCDENGL